MTSIVIDTLDSKEWATPPDETIDRDAVQSTLKEYPLRLAILFGSYVDGTPTPQSDIDVGVLFEKDCRQLNAVSCTSTFT